MLHKSLSGEIIGAGIQVSSALKPGLSERIYENALVLELRERGLSVEQQKPFPVYYKDEKVGQLIPDLIVNDKVIIDTKVVADFNQSHMEQMIGYLAITDLKLALIFIFHQMGIK